MYSNVLLLTLVYLFTVFLSITKAHPSVSKPHEARSASSGFGTITTVTNGSIIRAAINKPPVNLWDYKLAADFCTFIETLAKTANASDVKVVILASANPEFFIDHIDIHALSAASPERLPANGTLTGVQLLRTEAYLQTLPIIFIAEINGRTTRALAMKSPFNATFATQVREPSCLSSKLGSASFPALEACSSCVDAIEAAAIRSVNKAFGSEKELTERVTALAERIAIFPKQGLAAIQSRVNVQKPTETDIRGDINLSTQLEKMQIVQSSRNQYLVLSANESANTFKESYQRMFRRY